MWVMDSRIACPVACTRMVLAGASPSCYFTASGAPVVAAPGTQSAPSQTRTLSPGGDDYNHVVVVPVVGVQRVVDDGVAVPASGADVVGADA